MGLRLKEQPESCCRSNGIGRRSYNPGIHCRSKVFGEFMLADRAGIPGREIVRTKKTSVHPVIFLEKKQGGKYVENPVENV